MSDADDDENQPLTYLDDGKSSSSSSDDEFDTMPAVADPYHSDEYRKKEKIRKFLSVGAALLGLVALIAVLLVNSKSADSRARFTFPNIFDGSFEADHMDLKFVDEGMSILRRNKDTGELYTVEIGTGVQNIVFSAENASDTLLYRSNADVSVVLVGRGSPRDASWRVVVPGPHALGDSIQAISLVGPARAEVAYVRGNNVFRASQAGGGSWTTERLTHDGDHSSVPQITNGVMPWVYSAELYHGATSAMWSSDFHLAFFRTNSSGVETYEYEKYSSSADEESVMTIYPTPGSQNPQVDVVVVDLSTGSRVTVKPVHELVECVSWTPGGQLLLLVSSDRTSSARQVSLVNPSTGKQTSLWQHRSPARGWLSVWDHIWVDDHTMAVLHPSLDYMQIAISDINNLGAPPRVITTGNFTVVSVEGFHFPYVYFSRAYPTPMDRSLFRVHLTSKVMQRVTPDTVGVYRALFSAGPYFIQFYDGDGSYSADLGVPSISIRDLRAPSLPVVHTLTNNSALRSSLDATAMPSVEHVTYEGLYASISYPVGFTPSLGYDVLLYVVGGPGTQSVTREYSSGYLTYLSSTHNYIVLRLDARGSGGRSLSFMHSVYHRLGVFESLDHIAFARWFLERRYVEKMSVWGFEGAYGGFLATSICEHPDHPFSACVATSPVADWSLYDSIYAERYMGTPLMNPGGYANSSTLDRVPLLRRAPFFLAHGLADERAHAVNAYLLSERLLRARVEFQQHYYTNEGHSLRHGRRDLYQRITLFLKSWGLSLND